MCQVFDLLELRERTAANDDNTTRLSDLVQSMLGSKNWRELIVD
jgi:hypothetical protein